MSVREIGTSHRSLTGTLTSVRDRRQHEFESRLERDLLIRLDIDPQVEKFEAQPLRIDYEDTEGRSRTYTPDVFAELRSPPTAPGSDDAEAVVDELLGDLGHEALLCEVKYQEELDERWDEFKERFEAARAFANKRNWRFEVLTEEDIETPFLENAHQLRPLAREPLVGMMGRVNRVVELVKHLGEPTAQEVASELTETADSADRAHPEVFRLVRQLLAQGYLGTDLYSTSFDEYTPLWPAPPSSEVRHGREIPSPLLYKRAGRIGAGADQARRITKQQIALSSDYPRQVQPHPRDSSKEDLLSDRIDPSEGAGWVSLSKGSEVSFRGEHFVVEHTENANEVYAVSTETGEVKKIPTSDLRPPEEALPKKQREEQNRERKTRDLLAISDKELQKAKERYEAIEPLLEIKGRKKEDVRKRAQEIGKSTATLYRYIKRFEEGSISTLADKKRKDEGTRKLASRVEEIIQEVILEMYLTKERPTAARVAEVTRQKCREDDEPLNPPSKRTVRRRIGQIPERRRVTARHGSKAAQDAFRPIGEGLESAYPLHIVQIDHTKVDLLLVNRETGEVLKHAWITLAIDVFSRMVCGYYISFDQPSAMTTGMCMARAILPKERFLERMDVEVKWPVWGAPTTIGADNAKEFRGKMLRNACSEYGIDIEHRPIGKSFYGGHVEKAFRTYMQRVHELEGTTFGSVEERGNYASETRARYTLGWLKRWFARFLIERYHQARHRGIGGTSPLEKWEEGVYGKGGHGPPPRPTNERKVRLDFMPFVRRPITKTHVTIDYITYRSDRTIDLINKKDENGNNPKYIFRYDPHDITKVWFLDPEDEVYKKVETARRRPSISIWEWRRAKDKAKKSRMSSKLNEERIFRADSRLRELEREKKGEMRHFHREHSAKEAEHREQRLRPSSLSQSTSPSRPSRNGTEAAESQRTNEDKDANGSEDEWAGGSGGFDFYELD